MRPGEESRVELRARIDRMLEREQRVEQRLWTLDPGDPEHARIERLLADSARRRKQLARRLKR